jgi:hypothetical protein
LVHHVRNHCRQNFHPDLLVLPGLEGLLYRQSRLSCRLVLRQLAS